MDTTAAAIDLRSRLYNMRVAHKVAMLDGDLREAQRLRSEHDALNNAASAEVRAEMARITCAEVDRLWSGR